MHSIQILAAALKCATLPSPLIELQRLCKLTLRWQRFKWQAAIRTISRFGVFLYHVLPLNSASESIFRATLCNVPLLFPCHIGQLCHAASIVVEEQLKI